MIPKEYIAEIKPLSIVSIWNLFSIIDKGRLPERFLVKCFKGGMGDMTSRKVLSGSSNQVPRSHM